MAVSYSTWHSGPGQWQTVFHSPSTSLHLPLSLLQPPAVNKNSCCSVFSTSVLSDFFIIANLISYWDFHTLFLQESSRTSIKANSTREHVPMTPSPKFMRPVCLYISFKLISFFFVEIQFTLEQHVFELHRSTYIQIFFEKNAIL